MSRVLSTWSHLPLNYQLNTASRHKGFDGSNVSTKNWKNFYRLNSLNHHLSPQHQHLSSEGSFAENFISFVILKKQSQCKYDTVSANIVIYQWRKVASVTLHRRPQLPFIVCLVFTVEAKAGLRLFWEPWLEQRERHLCNETHSLCLSFSQLEKGTSFAPKHSLLLSECVSVTQMREAPLCHKGKSGGLLLKHWISVSL